MSDISTKQEKLIALLQTEKTIDGACKKILYRESRKPKIMSNQKNLKVGLFCFFGRSSRFPVSDQFKVCLFYKFDAADFSLR